MRLGLFLQAHEGWITLYFVRLPLQLFGIYLYYWDIVTGECLALKGYKNPRPGFERESFDPVNNNLTVRPLTSQEKLI